MESAEIAETAETSTATMTTMTTTTTIVETSNTAAAVTAAVPVAVPVTATGSMPTSARELVVTIRRVKELPPSTKRQVDLLTQGEFGALDLVRRYQWAEPHWMAVATKGREVVNFVGVLEHTVLFDGQPTRVVGISNAVTPEEHRRKGYSRAVLDEVCAMMFRDGKADCGLLLCRDHLVAYYEKLGWYAVKCPVQLDQQDGKKVWMGNTMLYSPIGRKFEPSIIDLQSYPW
jgi:hypothetical protein